MISEANQKILELFSESPDRCVSVERLKALLGSDYQPRIENLLENRFIEQADCVQIGSFDEHFRFEPTSYRITILDRDALTEKQRSDDKVIQDIANSKADEKTRKRSALKNAAFNLFVALVGAAFGSLVTYALEHKIDVLSAIQAALNWVVSLFH